MFVPHTSIAFDGVDARCVHPRAVVPVGRHGSSGMVEMKSKGAVSRAKEAAPETDLGVALIRRRVTSSAHHHPQTRRERYNKSLASPRNEQCIPKITRTG